MVLFTMFCVIFQFAGAADTGADRTATSGFIMLAAAAQEPDVLPIPVYKALRSYPESARRDSLEGTVWVEAVVDAAGHVQNARIKTGVRADLDDAALSCIRQWVFQPAYQKGKPISCPIVMPFHFKMKK